MPPSTPAKQTTLDGFLVGANMPRSSIKRNRKGQSADTKVHVGLPGDSIESQTPVSSPIETSKSKDKKGKLAEKKAKPSKPELDFSTLRRSPRTGIQKSNLIPKTPLPLIRSHPAPISASKPVGAEPPPFPLSHLSSLPINTHENKDHQASRSPSKAASSYYTALSSPMSSQENLSLPEKFITSGAEAVKLTRPIAPVHEVPSSVPWENTPSDGYGDAWPSSQSDSSPALSLKSKPSLERIMGNQSRIAHGLSRPPSKTSLDDTQDESQPDKFVSISPEKMSQTHTDDGFRIPPLPNRAAGYVEETQDEESQQQPVAGTKRKRVPTFNEVPESSPPVQQSPTLLSKALAPEEDSLVLLSQAPPHMRKPTPELITIHSSQSQTQDIIASSPILGPRATSIPLSPSSNHRPLSQSSQASSILQYPHNWNSSQPTQPPVDAMPDCGRTGPPSRSPILEINKIPEPLRLTLEHKYPQRLVYEGLPDLDQLERQQDAQLEKWQEENTRRKSKSPRK